MNKLKNCPFCDSDKIQKLQYNAWDHIGIYIQCPTCQARGGPFKSDQEEACIAAWNKRANPYLSIYKMFDKR